MVYKQRVALAVLIATMLLGCGLVGGPAAPPGDVPVSEEAAARLETKIQEAAASSQGEQVQVTLTEEEVTSYLRLRLQTEQLQSAQVQFEPGRIILTGQATVGITQNIRMVASPRVENGIVQFDFSEAKFGPLPIPQSILDIANDQLRQALTSNVAQVDQVDVGDGTITVSGRRA